MQEIVQELTQKTIKEMLQEGVCAISFTKVSDGSVRKMKATLSADLIPAAPATEGDSTPRAENPDVQAVWDLEAQGWRSFRWDSLVSVTNYVQHPE